MEDRFDTTELTAEWNRRWPGCRPIGREFRVSASELWFRFHSLPQAKRYAENELERDEILRRHNLVIDELVSGTGPAADSTSIVEDQLLVVSCSHSGSAEPVPLPPAVQAASPGAVHWQSVLREGDAEDQFWNHLYVELVPWHVGALDQLLVLVADWEAIDVFLAPMNLDWLFHPYDGGADVVVSSQQRRDVLREQHAAWLPDTADGL